MEAFQAQAQHFGARINYGTLTGVRLQPGGPHTLKLTKGDVIETAALIVATGARPRWLGLPSEEALKNKGVSACATCDGPLFRDVPVVVVGGGDTAAEEALFLSRFASEVTIVHRRNELRASKILQERVFANDKVDVCWDSVVAEVLDVAQDKVTGAVVRNVKTDTESTLPCEAVFMAIGHTPNTEVFQGQLGLDAAGYVILQQCDRSFTNVDGVFAAGDCADMVYRQAVTAAGMGCRAAIDAERWLAARE
jgi:thioredoxin reductase (NADPH)